MPRGRPLDETPEEIRNAALTDERDEGEAQAFARSNLPRPFQRLSEAEPISEAEIQRRRRANNLPEL